MKSKLFKEDSAIDENNLIAGDEWTTAEIDWRYFSSVAQPTIASHAEEVADDNDDKEDFNPTQKPAERFAKQRREKLWLIFLTNLRHRVKNTLTIATWYLVSGVHKFSMTKTFVLLL